LALKETCRRHAVSTYHVLVDAVSSFFCGQPPDLAWLQESANTALNFHPVIACKRWPYFPQLAEAFADVVIVGTADDLRRNDGAPFQFPLHARIGSLKHFLRRPAGRARPSIPRRRPRRTPGAGVPPRAPPEPPARPAARRIAAQRDFRWCGTGAASCWGGSRGKAAGQAVVGGATSSRCCLTGTTAALSPALPGAGALAHPVGHPRAG
jgi:hypothetical protein